MSPLANLPIKEPRSVNFEVLCRIRAEYEEMPGLLLTEKQAARLWGCDPESCRALLMELEGAGFLVRTRTGAFVRA